MSHASKQDPYQQILANATSGAESGAFYDELWSSVKPNQKVGYNKVRIDFFAEAFAAMEANESREILDLGCGIGWLAEPLSVYGRTTGIDFSPKTLDRARKTYGTYGQFVLADGDSPRLGLPDDQRFDVVVSSEVIEHVSHPQAFLLQVNQFLKPGGWLLLTTPNALVWEPYSRDERRRHWRQPIEHWLTPKELVSKVEYAGFTIQQHRGWTSESYGYSARERFLVRRKVKGLFRGLGLTSLYQRLLRPVAIYQMMIARKQTERTPADNR